MARPWWIQLFLIIRFVTQGRLLSLTISFVSPSERNTPQWLSRCTCYMIWLASLSEGFLFTRTSSCPCVTYSLHAKLLSSRWFVSVQGSNLYWKIKQIIQWERQISTCSQMKVAVFKRDSLMGVQSKLSIQMYSARRITWQKWGEKDRKTAWVCCCGRGMTNWSKE